MKKKKRRRRRRRRNWPKAHPILVFLQESFLIRLPAGNS